MRIFVISVFLYVLLASLVILVWRDNPFSLLNNMLAKLPGDMFDRVRFVSWLVPTFLIYVTVFHRETWLRRLGKTVLALILSILFIAVFTMVKGTMPMILPFWTDPMLAELDRVLHFGTDPWKWTQSFYPYISNRYVAVIYYEVWLIPAMQLPVLIAMFDGDESRFVRFSLLYVFTWVGLGNIIALPLLSAGPVYYDRLYDPDRFQQLMAALDQMGITTGKIGEIMGLLWKSYESGAQIAGSGISAFPSVHVGMATVVALYLFERNRLFVIPAIMIVATYQFLSIYQGWHYAIDGYFSIIAVVFVWQLLRCVTPRIAARKTIAAA